jgi:hypothetical protein
MESQHLSTAQPHQIIAYGTEEAKRHLSPLSEETVPEKPPVAVFRLKPAPSATIISPERMSFGEWVARFAADVLDLGRLYGLALGRWWGRLFWRHILRRCPDYGCHRPLERGYSRPYGFPGSFCPRDHHFYHDKRPET